MDPCAPVPAAGAPGRNGAGRRHRWRHLASAGVGAGWAVMTALLAASLARELAWDRWELFAWADAATLVLFLPSLPVLALSLWRRRWALAGVSAVVVAAYTSYAVPELAAGTAPPAPGAHVTIRLLDANVRFTNPDMAGYERAVASVHPDVVTLEEPTPGDIAALSSSPALRRLPYRAQVDDATSRGLFVASRYPLGPVVVTSIDHLPYLLRTSLLVDGRRLALWVVHTTAPVNPRWNRWNEELDRIAALARRAHPRPALVVGDFNATWGNRGFRALLGTGLTDAAAARGAWLEMNWPQVAFLPPMLRIDHVLTGPQVAPGAIWTEAGPGSDHRILVARVLARR